MTMLLRRLSRPDSPLTIVMSSNDCGFCFWWARPLEGVWVCDCSVLGLLGLSGLVLGLVCRFGQSRKLANYARFRALLAAAALLLRAKRGRLLGRVAWADRARSRRISLGYCFHVVLRLRKSIVKSRLGCVSGLELWLFRLCSVRVRCT